MIAKILLVAVVVAVGLWDHVNSHGYLAVPVNRGSMWRFGYPTPPDYDDNQQYCGGKGAQWNTNGGKCGECGDNYAHPRPRAHENTAKYGLGISVGRYSSGATIGASALLTANHRGFFEFKLCPLRNRNELETQACFDQHLLRVQGGSSSRYHVPNPQPGVFNLTITLPRVTCELCVLQWTYTTANTWGSCGNGTSAQGCGPQETFRTCSDITIV